MEKVGRPANLSLRYSLSQRSFESKASSSALEPSADNDVDFDDVFGGPPTRTRYSFGGTRIKSSEESSSSLSGLGERPVFGESPGKRISDDFYDDIFRTSDESVRSPRWPSSSPAPLSSSLPSEFSLPPKMNEDVGLPVFGSNVPLSRFSSPATQLFTTNSGQSLGQTLLSRESSSAKDSAPEKVKTTGTRSPSNEFHFSIHKWPNVGVPLLVSLRGGKYPTLKGSSKVSALSMDNMQDSGVGNGDLSAKKEGVNPVSGVSLMEVIEKETLQVKKQEADVQEVVAPSSLLHDELERKGYEEAGREAETKEKVEAKSSKKKREAKNTKKAEANKHSVGSPKNRVKGMVKDFFKISNQESPPKTKTNVSSRWKTGGKNRTPEEVNDTNSNLDSNTKIKTDASKTTKVASELPVETVRVATDASSTIPLDGKTSAQNVKMAPDASKAKPLDGKTSAQNVKMAPDASKAKPLDGKTSAQNVKMAPDAPKAKPLDGKTPAQNVKMTPDASKPIPLDGKMPAQNVKMVPDASKAIPLDDKMPADNVNKKVKEEIGRSNKPKYAQNRTIRKLEDINFPQDTSPFSDSVPYGSKASVENIDDPTLDNFQVQELDTVEDNTSKTQEESEAIMALDSKIHMWSSGRKGNIRSLLSTLQLVLWAGSGWKPVALVDIIEANAVKKAYNRAMLCLHPDKLQQKGADSHKKYIAEKVFDILQEAWDHFNTLGTLL